MQTGFYWFYSNTGTKWSPPARFVDCVHVLFPERGLPIDRLREEMFPQTYSSWLTVLILLNYRDIIETYLCNEHDWKYIIEIKYTLTVSGPLVAK